MDLAELSLYVHVPFCTRKCGYCDFYSIPVAGRSPDRFVSALVTELRHRAAELQPRFATVFVGGGTPTVLGPDELSLLFRAIRAATGGRAIRELTVEANPETLDDAKARTLHDNGANRVSLGAQSFQRSELMVLDRLHDPAAVGAAVRAARSAGFEEINLDLIFGIPGQTMTSWHSSLKRALELQPTHVACYALTYEPGTELTSRRQRGLVEPCDEVLEAEMFYAAIDELTAAGFEHYEISNYARPGSRCEHNLRYWRNEPYLGIGPSAASYVNGRRWRNAPDLDRYLQAAEKGASPEIESETLAPLAALREHVMLGLRMREGVNVPGARRRFGADPRLLFALVIERFVCEGLLSADEDAIRLTRKGLIVADSIMAEFLTGAVDAAAVARLEASADNRSHAGDSPPV